MEIITGVERRRQWRDEEKLRILAELDEPGVKFSAVARRHDVSRSLLWQWRDAQRRGRLVAETPAFVPLQVVPELPAPERTGQGQHPTPAAVRPCRARQSHRDRAAGRHRGSGHRGDQRRCPAARAGGAARMIPTPSGVRVWLAVGHTDMRRGMHCIGAAGAAGAWP